MYPLNIYSTLMYVFISYIKAIKEIIIIIISTSKKFKKLFG